MAKRGKLTSPLRLHLMIRSPVLECMESVVKIISILRKQQGGNGASLGHFEDR